MEKVKHVSDVLIILARAVGRGIPETGWTDSLAYLVSHRPVRYPA